MRAGRYGKIAGIFFLAFLALLAAAPLSMQLSVSPYAYPSADEAPPREFAIVLGASVFRGEPSPVLASRADEAVALYQSGKVKKILVSGDNGEPDYDEVTPVRKYLLAAGIPARDIFLDRAGFDTYESMYRARAVFGIRSAAIVTQEFHLPRALFLARALGIDAIGVVAGGPETVPYEYAREIPADWKALLDLALRR